MSHFVSCHFVNKGDSGGPLIQKGGDATGADDILVGIVLGGWGVRMNRSPEVRAHLTPGVDKSGSRSH